MFLQHNHLFLQQEHVLLQHTIINVIDKPLSLDIVVNNIGSGRFSLLVNKNLNECVIISVEL